MTKNTILELRCPELLLDAADKIYRCRRTGGKCNYLVSSNCPDYHRAVAARYYDFKLKRDRSS